MNVHQFMNSFPFCFKDSSSTFVDIHWFWWTLIDSSSISLNVHERSWTFISSWTHSLIIFFKTVYQLLLIFIDYWWTLMDSSSISFVHEHSWTFISSWTYSQQGTTGALWSGFTLFTKFGTYHKYMIFIFIPSAWRKLT